MIGDMLCLHCLHSSPTRNDSRTGYKDISIVPCEAVGSVFLRCLTGWLDRRVQRFPFFEFIVIDDIDGDGVRHRHFSRGHLVVAVVRIVFIAQSIVELRGQLGDEGQREIAFMTHETHRAAFDDRIQLQKVTVLAGIVFGEMGREVRE